MTDAAAAKPTKPAGPFSAWEFGLALRYLKARRKEGGIALIAIISYAAIALAVMALITVMSIMAGFRSELFSRVLSFNGHMYVQGQLLTSPEREAAIARLKAVPGVVHVSPLIENQSLVRAGGQTTGAFVRGVRPQDLASMTYVYASLSAEAKGTFGKGVDGGDDVLIGQALADKLGLRVGSPVTLYSPTGVDSVSGDLGGREKTYRVGGIFRSGASDFDQAFLFMPLEQAQIFFGKVGVWDVIEMKVRQPDQVERLSPAVRRAAGPTALISDWRERLAAFWGALQLNRAAMGIILGLVVAIAALNIISGIVMLVKNKTRDIAILRTVGASRSSMLRVFFIAGAAIGVAGTVTGLILGLLFCLNIGPIQHFLEGLLGVQLFNADVYVLDAVPALVDPLDVLWVAVWSVFMSCVASLLPSWLAARMDPVDALRHE